MIRHQADTWVVFFGIIIIFFVGAYIINGIKREYRNVSLENKEHEEKYALMKEKRRRERANK